MGGTVDLRTVGQRALRSVLPRRDRLVDRYLLEDVIFPQLLADAEIEQVLFVGCAAYTRDYPKRFASKHFRTIDNFIDVARFGSEDHILDSFANLADHVAPATLDAVICNGVVGFGLDDLADANRAFGAAHDCLRPGGWLVYGWNEDPRFLPFRPEDIGALEQFERAAFQPFQDVRHRTYSPFRHVFDFYRRPL